MGAGLELVFTGPSAFDWDWGRDDSHSCVGHGIGWRRGELGGVAFGADGSVDGVKDGFIDLSEIEVYTKRRTQEIGGHNPTTIGCDYQFLIMNEVPGATYLEGVEGGTDSLSDAQIRASAAILERALTVD